MKEPKTKEQRIEELLSTIRNPYIYFWHPRNWRKAGITPEEIKLRYEKTELNKLCFLTTDKCEKTEFPYVEYREIEALVELSKLEFPAEKIVQLIMSHREAGIREMIKDEKKNLEWYKQVALEYEEKDSQYAEGWIKHSEDAFNEICIMCKWIGIEPPKEM